MPKYSMVAGHAYNCECYCAVVPASPLPSIYPWLAALCFTSSERSRAGSGRRRRWTSGWLVGNRTNVITHAVHRLTSSSSSCAT